MPSPSFRQHTCQITVRTPGPGLHEFTAQVEQWVSAAGIETGLLTLFIRHTSASLTIQENADPDVLFDLNQYFTRLVPPDSRFYRHTAEGPDDMPAHIRSALTATQLSIPVVAGQLVLGTWQGIYVFEHRAQPHRRQIVLHLFGE
ncbi:MAG: secondary thiamine-phosphate synthase enzyme YjbQ [Acidobacteria bacterium]|nr:secondary thiamine-phosphate synthase enzyme YjbQ [Acidobacteriota bacterium]